MIIGFTETWSQESNEWKLYNLCYQKNKTSTESGRHVGLLLHWKFQHRVLLKDTFNGWLVFQTVFSCYYRSDGILSVEEATANYEYCEWLLEELLRLEVFHNNILLVGDLNG